MTRLIQRLKSQLRFETLVDPPKGHPAVRHPGS